MDKVAQTGHIGFDSNRPIRCCLDRLDQKAGNFGHRDFGLDQNRVLDRVLVLAERAVGCDLPIYLQTSLLLSHSHTGRNHIPFDLSVFVAVLVLAVLGTPDVGFQFHLEQEYC